MTIFGVGGELDGSSEVTGRTRGRTRRWPPHNNCRRAWVEEEVDIIAELGGVDSAVPVFGSMSHLRIIGTGR